MLPLNDTVAVEPEQIVDVVAAAVPATGGVFTDTDVDVELVQPLVVVTV